ncbi:MAG: hypothetical protein Q9M91_06865 [Candidatus Dojkabacteria bacterium]|nr:hypothetical protein [Candidatus Dojkabacteria bacterium]
MNVLVSNPEHFQLILNFKAVEVEVFVNSLEIAKALGLAKLYAEMIKTLESVAIVVSKDSLRNFSNSRANIKAEMTLLRCNIFSIGIDKEVTEEGICSKVRTIRNLLTKTGDISRLNNYKVMYLLKSNKPRKAIDFFLERFSKANICEMTNFDLFWMLKSINDALLNNADLKSVEMNELVKKAVSEFDFNKRRTSSRFDFEGAGFVQDTRRETTAKRSRR